MPMPILYFSGSLKDWPDVKSTREMDLDGSETPTEEDKTRKHKTMSTRAQSDERIPIPEVWEVEDYTTFYPPLFANALPPEKLIRANLDYNTPDFDADTSDEEWINSVSLPNLDLTKMEHMIDKLECGSQEIVVTLDEAKDLLRSKSTDEVEVTAVYDYWLHKRLKKAQPLVVRLKSKSSCGSGAGGFDPYVVFTNRMPKQYLRKNRREDENAYIKMLKLRQDMSRAAMLLKLIKRREDLKYRKLLVQTQILDKRYQMKDYSGELYITILGQIYRKSAGLPNTLHLNRPAFHPTTHSTPQSSIKANDTDCMPLAVIQPQVRLPPFSYQPAISHYRQQASLYKLALQRQLAPEAIKQCQTNKSALQRSNGNHAKMTTKQRQQLKQPQQKKNGVRTKEQIKMRRQLREVQELHKQRFFNGTHKNHVQQYSPLSDLNNNEPMDSSTTDAVSLESNEETDDADESRGLSDQKLFELTPVVGSQFHAPRKTMSLELKFETESIPVGNDKFIRGWCRVGRGGRVVVDRTSRNVDEFWSALDFTIFDNGAT